MLGHTLEYLTSELRKQYFGFAFPDKQ